MTISDKELEGIGKAIWESFGFREMTDEERMISDAEVKQYLQENAIPFSDWLTIHDTTIRNATLDKVIEWVDNADNHTKDPGNGKHYVCLPDLIIFTESLRTQQEQP